MENDQLTNAIVAWLERMEAKQDVMVVDMAAIKADLAYHIKRTDLLQEEMSRKSEALKEDLARKATTAQVTTVKTQVEDLATEVEPVVTHVNRIKWAVGAFVFLLATYKMVQSVGLLP